MPVLAPSKPIDPPINGLIIESNPGGPTNRDILAAFGDRARRLHDRPFTIDWFQGTSHTCNPDDAMKDLGGEWTKTRGFARYDRQMTNGMVILCWSTSEKMKSQGLFVLIKGSSVPDMYVDWLFKNEFKPSRLDIAFDTSGMTVDEISQAVLGRRVQYPGREENVDFYSKMDGTSGVTFGDRKSDKYVRCYDKGRQMGMKDVTWTRVEYEFKNRTAKHIWQHLDKAVDFCVSTWRMLKRPYKNLSHKTCKLDPKFAKLVCFRERQLWDKLVVARDKSIEGFITWINNCSKAIKTGLGNVPGALAALCLAEEDHERAVSIRAYHHRREPVAAKLQRIVRDFVSGPDQLSFALSGT